VFAMANDLTSSPAYRKRNARYFDFKHLQIYAHFDVSYIFI